MRDRCSKCDEEWFWCDCDPTADSRDYWARVKLARQRGASAYMVVEMQRPDKPTEGAA